MFRSRLLGSEGVEFVLAFGNFLGKAKKVRERGSFFEGFPFERTCIEWLVQMGIKSPESNTIITYKLNPKTQI